MIGLASLLFPERWEKRVLVIFLLWLNVVAALLIGPSQVLHFPNNPVLIGVGLFIGGSTRSLVGAYIIVEGSKAGGV